VSRFQAIENELKSINGAVFQELCDSYLKLNNANYLAFSRAGSQSGKQKTTKGTPDSFFLLPNGNYIFIEITTDISTKNKLSNDINACFDFKKSRIPKNKITEIILCFNWDIDQEEIQILNEQVRVHNEKTTVRYVMLQDLALNLHLNHRDLVHEYLGLPLDTGQIVSRETFVAEYNKASNGISTPIDNTFLHRENELEELKEIIQSDDFIVLTGSAGIGKTKLAIEGINSFLAENLAFSAYCISYKHNSLLDDLYQYFDKDKDYILFVDDANRIDAFNQITGFYRSLRKGKLKIIITVRDYAFQVVKSMCPDFTLKIINLIKLTDDQIIDIIKAKPFEILNPNYHKEIKRIADGNPRIAIMVALLAKAEQKISALSDVSELFENYFSTFSQDDGEFALEINIKCLGLIAFFHTIPYRNIEICKQILTHFDIEYSDFVDSIDKLDSLELVEIQYEYVKIPEQNLSTFFFYKAFVKESTLSFNILLDKYFDSNPNRFRDCVIPAYNTFGPRKVMEKLKPHLKNHWSNIKSNEEEAFNFLYVFWFYLPIETLEFLYNHIESLPKDIAQEFIVNTEYNQFDLSVDRVIKLLANYFVLQSDYLKDALEISFEYIRKIPNRLTELFNKIRGHLIFDIEDEKYNFKRQIVLFNILIDGLNKSDHLFEVSFFALSKVFLSSKYQHTEGGRHNSFSWYKYEIPNTVHIQEFRRKIWSVVHSIFDNQYLLSFDLLKNYPYVGLEGFSKEIIYFDLQFIIPIIETHLSTESFEHCRYVQELIQWYNRNSISHSTFSSLKENFTNSAYKTFLKIEWNRFRDKEMFEFDNYNEYENLKTAEIRNSFLFNQLSEIEEFYKLFTYLYKMSKNNWSYRNTLDLIVDSNFSKNFSIGCLILKTIIKMNNGSNYIPRIPFINNLKTGEKSDQIWNIIQANSFNLKTSWEFAYYAWLQDDLIDNKHVTLILNSIKSLLKNDTIYFGRLKRFLAVEPRLFQNILKIIFEKNRDVNSTLFVEDDFFDEYFDHLGNDYGLIGKAYLQQIKYQNNFDIDGKGFLNILSKNRKFLQDYISDLFLEEHYRVPEDSISLGIVWEVEEIEAELENVFDYIVEKEEYFGILVHYCNSFFRNLNTEAKQRAGKFLIDYASKNIQDTNKINVVVDITRHSMRNMFEEVLLLFLSLCQDKDIFSKIMWRGNGVSAKGIDVILADIEMAEWKNIQTIVDKSNVGIKLIPIKTYINEKVENCYKSGDDERRRRFLENW